MANKKKRKPHAPRPPAATSAPRPAKRTGPSHRELQLAAQRKARRQATMRRAGVTGAIALVGVAVVGGAVALDRRGGRPRGCDGLTRPVPAKAPPGR